MTFRRLLLCLVIPMAVAGCGSQQKTMVQAAGPPERIEALQGPPEITSESEDGFRDLVFYVETESAKQVGAPRRLHASGTYKGESVGFDFDWGEKGSWQAFPIKGLPKPFYKDRGRFRSKGADSDRLLLAMAELYVVSKPKTKMAKETVVTLFALQGNPRVPEKGLVRGKLFFNEDSEKYYGELFLVLDLPRGRLVLAEKDPEYRLGVVQSLGGAQEKR